MKRKGATKDTLPSPNRFVRADAQRNLESLLQAAAFVFERSGVDAPVREIAEKAGVGVGTLYRHFRERSDLILAVMQKEVDDCAGAAAAFTARHEPGEALSLWMQRLVDLFETKRGLGSALYSKDSAYQSLPEYFLEHLTPALVHLLDTAQADGAVRVDIDVGELLMAAIRLATLASEGDVAQARRMVALLVDGLRFGARGSPYEAIDIPLT